MKIGLLLLLLAAQATSAQTIVLLDRDLKNPVLLTKQLTQKQLTGNMFPVFASDIETVIRLADSLLKQIVIRNDPYTELQMLKAGHSQLAVTSNTVANTITYGINLMTRAADVGATMELVKKGDVSKRAAQRLQQFLDYLKNNKHLIKEY